MKAATRHALIASLVTSLIGLSGCKVSGSDGDSEATLIQGRAATDTPMVGATIDIKDANGQQFRVYSDGSGYFALILDSEEDSFDDLAAPIIVRATNNEDVYHSVLCNLVYGELDSVNVHPLTEYVMDQTSPVDNAYALWETTAKGNYCNAAFAYNFRATASTLGTSFNFFNSAFDANNTGFDAILDSFNPATFTPVAAADDFHIVNGLGSLVVIPGTIWSIAADGTFNGLPYSDARNLEVPVNPQGLRNLVDTLLEDETAQDVEIESLVITLEGDGIGEEGTTVQAKLKGKAVVNAVSQAFNITVDLERVADAP